jgi:16S rRNA U1498 N3-methylase RsmE
VARVALASVKQSRRAVLPEIRVPLTLENALTELAAALRMMLVEADRWRARGADVRAARSACPSRRDALC